MAKKKKIVRPGDNMTAAQLEADMKRSGAEDLKAYKERFKDLQKKKQVIKPKIIKDSKPKIIKDSRSSNLNMTPSRSTAPKRADALNMTPSKSTRSAKSRVKGAKNLVTEKKKNKGVFGFKKGGRIDGIAKKGKTKGRIIGV